MRDIIACQLERRLTADAGLGILGEGGEAIKLFEDCQIGLGAVDRLEVAEVLVMLVEAADRQLGNGIGGRDDIAADGVGELRPMAFQEVEDRQRGWGSNQEGLFE